VWRGDTWFLVRSLVLRDFRVRYRNMSLGMGWSLLNPLVMMSVMTFVFARLFNSTENYWVYVLSGLLPYNFFAMAWSAGATSVAENESLVKKVPIPGLILPASAVLAHAVHLLLHFVLFLILVAAFTRKASPSWAWLPLLFAVNLIFVVGLATASSAINVFVRDTRYIIDSLSLVLFWLVPVFYPISIIPVEYRDSYALNPITALVTGIREVIINDTGPSAQSWLVLVVSAAGSLGLGMLLFRLLEGRFYKNL